MIANSRCIACILSKQERKIRKNSDEQKKKEYIHKVLKILYEYRAQKNVLHGLKSASKTYIKNTMRKMLIMVH